MTAPDDIIIADVAAYNLVFNQTSTPNLGLTYYILGLDKADGRTLVWRLQIAPTLHSIIHLLDIW